MIRFNFILFLLLLSLPSFSQLKMRNLEELVNNADPIWTYVNQWIETVKNKIEILSVDTVNAKGALYKTQVTTRSPMGAVVYETGGLLIDHVWIRILGSGNAKLKRTLPDWNKGKTFAELGQVP